jgi:hypothetical protein
VREVRAIAAPIPSKPRLRAEDDERSIRGAGGATESGRGNRPAVGSYSQNRKRRRVAEYGVPS